MGLPLPRSERKIPTCLAVLTQCRSVTDSRTDGHACGQKLAQKEPILKGKQALNRVKISLAINVLKLSVIVK